MVGGSSDPSVPWSPGVTLQEKAGRPMGPSTLRCEFPWEVVLFYVWLLFGSSGFYLLFVMPLLFLRGRFFVFVPLSPSRPGPYSVFVCVRLLFLSGSFRRRRFSLSRSFSGAGEPQTFLVWGSPCVSSSWTRSPPSTRTPSSSPTPRHRPAPVFFFFVVVARFRFGVFLVSCLVGVGGLGGWLFRPWSWSLSGCRFETFLGLVALSSLFWVGGVPLAAFSLWFPLGSRVDWGCVLLSSFCRLLHLASPLALRETWSMDLQPPRPLQPFALARPASPVSCWESTVGRAEVRGCKVTGGFVTPHTV